MRKFINRKLPKAVITIVTAVILAYVISYISNKVNFLERFALAITDIDFSDLYYQKKDKLIAQDTNIVLVNIGDLNRAGIAELIAVISAKNPSAIGVDILFNEENDSVSAEGTQKLAAVLSSIKNLYIASSYGGKDDEGNEIIAAQSPIIKSHALESLVNLNIAEDDPEMGTVRSFNPLVAFNGKDVISFGFGLAALAGTEREDQLSEEDMFVRWYGYGRRSDIEEEKVIFETVDWSDILEGNFHENIVRGKIVIIGFLGKNLQDRYSPEEKFYTPLNGKMIGRSLPDMYGAEIHANVVKMIIDDDFIYHSAWLDFVINFGLIGAFTFLLFFLNRKYPGQYSIISKIALIIFIDLLIVTSIAAFELSGAGIKILIGQGLFIILFLPDTYEFMEGNVFKVNESMT